MATDYFAQVTQGIVSDVRRVTAERIAENPDLYPGVWIDVPDMDHYPAIGWTWTEADGFQPPVDG
jgi:hypothetical protein